MNYGDIRGYRLSLKDLFKDRKKNVLRKYIIIKNFLWCNNVDMMLWILFYFWIYVYEYIKVLGFLSVFWLMDIDKVCLCKNLLLFYIMCILIWINIYKNWIFE